MKISVWLQAILLLIATAFPPFYFALPGGATSHAGFHFFFDPPATTHATLNPTQIWNIVGRVDLLLVGAEWVFIIAGGYLVRRFLLKEQKSNVETFTFTNPEVDKPTYCFIWFKRTSRLAAVSLLAASIPILLMTVTADSKLQSTAERSPSEAFKIQLLQDSDEQHQPLRSYARDIGGLVAGVLGLVGSCSLLASMYWLAATASAFGRSFVAWLLGQLLFWPIGFAVAYYRLNILARQRNLA